MSATVIIIVNPEDAVVRQRAAQREWIETLRRNDLLELAARLEESAG